MLPHGWRRLKLMRQDNRGFMLAAPLTNPPRSRPIPSTARLNRAWLPGGSCGSCSNCCHFGGHACPLLDQQPGRCLGYDGFYWRYFNCGRFPSAVEEIDYCGCHKWVLIPTVGAAQCIPAMAVAVKTQTTRGLVVDPPQAGLQDAAKAD